MVGRKIGHFRDCWWHFRWLLSSQPIVCFVEVNISMYHKNLSYFKGYSFAASQECGLKSWVTVFLTSALSPVAPSGSAAQPFSPFWFTVEPQDTLVIRGNSALLNCSAHSDVATPARIEWKKDGTFLSLVSDERRRILPDGALLFTHVVHSKHNKPDEGTYQCVATIENLGSISSRTARLSVAGERFRIYYPRINGRIFKVSTHLFQRSEMLNSCTQISSSQLEKGRPNNWITFQLSSKTY